MNDTAPNLFFSRALTSLPDYLRKSTFHKNEEMLSSQMLSGIPEIDLGIEEKIRNIEATESAKKKLAEAEAKRRKTAPSEFVPTNLAVNFKKPDRFKTEVEPEGGRAKPVDKVTSIVTQQTVVVGEVPQEKVISLGGGDLDENDPKRATDDIHLSKFKQHFQRK